MSNANCAGNINSDITSLISLIWWLNQNLCTTADYLHKLNLENPHISKGLSKELAMLILFSWNSKIVGNLLNEGLCFMSRWRVLNLPPSFVSSWSNGMISSFYMGVSMALANISFWLLMRKKCFFSSVKIYFIILEYDIFGRLFILGSFASPSRLSIHFLSIFTFLKTVRIVYKSIIVNCDKVYKTHTSHSTLQILRR